MLSGHVITHEVDDWFVNRTQYKANFPTYHAFPAVICRGRIWSLSLHKFCRVYYSGGHKSKLCISYVESFKLYLILDTFV